MSGMGQPKNYASALPLVDYFVAPCIKREWGHTRIVC